MPRRLTVTGFTEGAVGPGVRVSATKRTRAQPISKSIKVIVLAQLADHREQCGSRQSPCPVGSTDPLGLHGYIAAGAANMIGFMGHVNDTDTGLTYMQQRYYDPIAGRMLSIDPVITDSNTGSSFNRYNGRSGSGPRRRY